MMIKKHVCLDLSAATVLELSKLSVQERTIVLWHLEDLALNLSKGPKFKLEDPLGTTGVWETPTVHHNVSFHWRYEGVESNKPVFYVDHAICTPKVNATEVAKEPSSGKYKTLNKVLLYILAGAIAVLAMFSQEADSIRAILDTLIAMVAYLSTK